ncbi:sensor histidine kinase [Pedobacter alpinus]|uniref:Sensor histidine kinase n=1 Tax=Pedobacter alpinus TaxID=1590643 RepID=A0ABW5TW45_9SPHI
MKKLAILFSCLINLWSFDGVAEQIIETTVLSKKSQIYFHSLKNTSNFTLKNQGDLKTIVYIRVGTQNLYKYHSIDVFRLQQGFNYALTLKVDSKNQVQNGPLTPYHQRSNNPDLQTFKVEILPNQVLKLSVSINNFELKAADNTIHIYNPEAYYELKNKEDKAVKTSLYISLLFLGSLIIMALFSFLIYLQNKSSDFLSYAGYLIFVLAFSIIADFPVKFNSFFIWDYPQVFIQSKETLVFAYLICYHLFLIKFLKLKERLKSVNKGLTIINYIFSIVIIVNIILLISTNLKLQNIAFKVNSVLLFAVIPYYAFIIYKLFRVRHYNFYKYILWGILFFYLGNIGGTFSQVFGWKFLGLLPNNYTQIGTFIELCFFSLGLGGKMVEESREKIKYQKQVLEVQMMALQAQMNPHFTFNCLNAIRNLILQNQNDKASSYLLKFSKLLRLTLENSIRKQISLEENITYLEMYLAMESLRFGESINYSINKNMIKNGDLIFLPPMLLQPFVENAIKHAFHQQAVNKTIKISFTEHLNILVIEVEDNGIGIQKHLNLSQADYKSRATEITKNYLAQWTSLYNRKIDLTIVDKHDLETKETGTLVKISLELD